MYSIKVFMGPMFSGKTTKLIKMCHSKRYFGIKHSIDLRYSKDKIESHDDSFIEKLDATSVNKLMDICSDLPSPEDIDIIAIDEGHFFVDLLEFCNYCKKLG